ncbi:MAG: spermidine/putrescine ABC transporter substrate-binding protein [Deltaproteobacteria bacterium]|jgi:spermidine/putrescine transport system substrate-binding protein|nr:spermidine/putrescine ABC transporter substrate-binding protein [Deltaproteobacteria bacterium]
MSDSPAWHKTTLLIFFLVIIIGVCAYYFFRPTASVERERNLNLFIWSEYIDPELIEEFQARHNVKVKMDLYESNEEMINKLQTGRDNVYDIIVPTTYFVPALKTLDLIRPLDHSLIPNLKNVTGNFANIDEDPGYKLTVPYQWGTSGLAVRAKDISVVPSSWKLLFDKDSTIGNIVFFDTARDALGSALKYLGYSLNTTNIDEIKQATELLIAAKEHPTFMGFDSGVAGLDKVMGNIAETAQVYSGEAIKAAKEDPELHYILPEEGNEIWLDLMAIPKNAPNAGIAHEFLNFILEPEVGAKIATFNNYATPNDAAIPFIPKGDLEDPGMYPTAERLAKMEYIKDLGDNNRLYDEAWNFVKSR